MLATRSMAVFAFDGIVPGRTNLLVLLDMTIHAIFFPEIFRLEIFPLPFV
jgi:hypothetical protein